MDLQEIHLADRESKLYVLRLMREIRNLVNVQDIPDSLFRRTFRLNKPLFRILMRELEPHLRNDEEVLAVPNTFKVLSVLHFYGHGSYQHSVGCNWLSCLGRSSVGRYIDEVTAALSGPQLQQRWIRLPRTRDGREAIKRRNEQAFRIPGVLGFVDGTEISIVKPPANLNPQFFWTHKGHYALNCQAVCEANLVLLSINAQYPGSTNDAFVWRHSGARRRMQEAFEDDESSWLLGDSAYPLSPWLLTPLHHAPPDSPEAYYTERHCEARCTIERCFGCLKNRWRCLLRERVLHYAPAKAANIFKACCLLHNMCRLAGLGDEHLGPLRAEEMEHLNDNVADPQLVVQEHDPHIRQVGRQVQNRLIEFLDMQRNGHV